MEVNQKYPNTYEIHHPLILSKLTKIRDINTDNETFRKLLKEITLLITYEITKDLICDYKEIETPLCKIEKAPIFDESKITVIPILRAGLGMVESVIELLPKAKIGHIGLYRDEETLEAKEYLAKIPSPAAELNIIVDPMFATGGSAIKAVEIMISKGITLSSIKYLSLVAAPEGLEKFSKKFPQIPVYTAKIDDHLNEKGYIVPGLGDAGDRIFGTEKILT